MKVTDILAQATSPLFTFELLPPLKGHTMESINSSIEALLPYNPAYINITNHQREVIYIEKTKDLVERRVTRKRPGTVALSAALQYRYQIPVVPHLICGGNSKEELEDQLVDLNFLGLNNVLALRGDPPRGERRFIAHQDGYEHTDQMIRQIEATNQGVYLDPTLRNPVATDFCIGIAGYPEKHFESPNLEHDIAMLKRKVDAGAHYIVTQMFFINEHYFKFVELCRQAQIEVPIIPGIKPLIRKRDLELLPQTFHIDFPVALVEAISAAKDASDVRKVGIEFTIKQVEELLRAQVPSIHFYTHGRSDVVGEVVGAIFGT